IYCVSSFCSRSALFLLPLFLCFWSVNSLPKPYTNPTMTSNTMNFGPEWMRGVPKRSNTSDSTVRSTSPIPPPNSSNLSIPSDNNNIPSTLTTATAATQPFSYSSVAATNLPVNAGSLVDAANLSPSTTTSSSSISASDRLNPFKYSKELMLSLYKPMGLPLEFERHEYVTAEESLPPMAFQALTDPEKKLLAGSVNSDLMRRIVTGTTSERTERPLFSPVSERTPRTPRGDRNESFSGPLSPGLRSPPIESPGRFGGASRGKGSGRDYFSTPKESPKEDDHPEHDNFKPRSFSLSSPFRSRDSDRPDRFGDRDRPDEIIWNGVTRHAVGTFDSNGVFRVGGAALGDTDVLLEPLEETEEDGGKKEIYGNVEENEHEEAKGKRDRVMQRENMLHGDCHDEDKNTFEKVSIQEDTVLHTTDVLPVQENSTVGEDVAVSAPVMDFEPTSFDHDHDDDVLKEAFSIASAAALRGTSPPSSPPVDKHKYTIASALGGSLGTPFSNVGNVITSTPSPVASVFGRSSVSLQPPRKPSEQFKWLYRDPSGIVQGPFSAQEMQEWYKAGFFTQSLLVRREDDPLFEPLGVLIRKVADDDKPFMALHPPNISSPNVAVGGGRPSLSITMPPQNRLLSDSFSRSGALFGVPGSPNTNPLVSPGGILSAQQQPTELLLQQQPHSAHEIGSGKFNPFGSGAATAAVHHHLHSVPGTPQSPSVLQSPFDQYRFGGGLFGTPRETTAAAVPWGDVPSSIPKPSPWGGNNDVFGASNPLSPLLQQPQSPLFSGVLGSVGGISGMPTQQGNQGYVDHQRVLAHQIQFLQQRHQQQLQQQQADVMAAAFYRQQHQQQHQQQVGPQSPPRHQQFHQHQPHHQNSASPHQHMQQQPPALSYVDARTVGWNSTLTTMDNNRDQQSQTSSWGSILSSSTSASRTYVAEEDSYNKQLVVESHQSEQQAAREPQPVQHVIPTSEHAPEGSGEVAAVDPNVVDNVQEISRITLGHESKGNTKAVSGEFVEGQHLITALTPAFAAVTLKKPPSLKDIQAEEAKKQSENTLQQQPPKTTVFTGRPSSQPASTKTVWGTSSAPGTPSSTTSAAPWARIDDIEVSTQTKGPSLREIQELEARKADARKAAERQAAEAALLQQVALSGDSNIPISMSWGVVVPNNKSVASNSAASTAAAAAGPAWGSTSTTKKTLREIQKEEEDAMKRKTKMREVQLQQQGVNASSSTAAGLFASSNLGAGSNTLANSPGAGKRYADSVNILAGARANVPTSAVTGWTTVTAGRSVPKTVAATTPPINASSNSSITTPRSSNNPGGAWDTTNGANAKPATRIQQTDSRSKVPGSDISSPKAPTEEFLKWCRQALKGLSNGVNVEEFMQMLLAFPVDPPSATVEIIQDMIYAYSPSLDGRRFADEFVKRRKADALGIPNGSTAISAGFTEIARSGVAIAGTFPKVIAPEDSASFKIVTKKGKKKGTL
ncbi:hypothetical protein BC937DRAFT_90298, partial [Endogone sp. FLAS-F59071]